MKNKELNWITLYDDLEEAVLIAHTSIGTYYISFIHTYGVAVSRWGIVTEDSHLEPEEEILDFHYREDSIPIMKDKVINHYLRNVNV